jgi:hypothetical protein
MIDVKVSNIWFLITSAVNIQRSITKQQIEAAVHFCDSKFHKNEAIKQRYKGKYGELSERSGERTPDGKKTSPSLKIQKLLTSWSRFIFRKLMVAQTVKRF